MDNSTIKDELRRAAREFASQIEQVAAEFRRGDIGDEDDISSQIVGRIKAVTQQIDGSITWTAKSVDGLTGIGVLGRRLTSRGKGAEETSVGADIVLVLDIDLPDYKVTKGLLIQAKCVNHLNEAKSSSERERLVSQCEDMLAISPASFVWTYGDDAVGVFSATSVMGSQGFFKHIFDTYDAGVFFYDFLICWIGDPRINSITRPALKVLIDSSGANHGLLLTARASKTRVTEEINDI